MFNLILKTWLSKKTKGSHHIKTLTAFVVELFDMIELVEIDVVDFVVVDKGVVVDKSNESVAIIDESPVCLTVAGVEAAEFDLVVVVAVVFGVVACDGIDFGDPIGTVVATVAGDAVGVVVDDVVVGAP
jgi:hypothetical protein